MIHHYARTRTRKRTIINNNLQTLLVTILLILHTPNLGKNNNNNIPLIYVSAQNDPTPVPTTLPPSPLPTNNPTNNPTATPTTSPTNSPTPVPTPIPTSSPTSTPTSSPTSSPTPLPTPSPTDSPSYKPSFTPVTPTSQNQLQSFTQEKIKMTFTGLSPLNKEEKAYLEEVTNTYIMTYFELSRSDIYDVTVDIEVTEMDPPYTGTDDVDTDEDNSSDTDADASGNGARRFRLLKGFTNTKIGMNGSLDANVNMRRLTDTNTFAIHSKRGRKTRTRNMQNLPQLSITYDHFMSYRIKDAANPKPEDLIKEPFSLLLDRSNYIAMLKNNQGGSNSNAQAFANLDKVSPPELISGKESVSMAGIIAGAVGGAVVLVMVVLFVLWRKRKKQRDQVPFDDDYNPARRRGNGVEMSNGILPSDGGSTLVEPSQQGVYTTGQSVVGGRYGPGSIATDDPDYQYQNPYEDPTIVSNTDGTLGDATRQSTQLQGGESILGSGGAQSIFSDDQSFEAFRNRDGRREEVLEIYAPAGKLGVVIDTPDTGAPVLHRIKETCPIADQLQVGDKLIAVDDEDVRSMTAVRVSKLISQKSSNPQRKFTIVRHHNT